MDTETPVINLEDDGPALETALPEPPPPVAAPPPVPEAEEEPIPDQVEGLISALRAERKEKKAFKERAEKVTQLEAELAQAKPYADFVRANPGLVQQRQEPAPVQAVEDPDAREAAELMDFYTADGKPDTARGARWLALQRKSARKEAQETVQPMHQAMAQAQSMRNFEMVANTPGVNGVKPDRSVLQAIWKRIAPSDTAVEGTAWGLHAIAVGFTKPGAAKVDPPPNAPLVSEPAGGNPKTKPTLSALEKKVAANKGYSEEKMAKLSEGHVAGRPFQLED